MNQAPILVSDPASGESLDGQNKDIVLYHYSFSPYARRILWYLALRGIQYAEVKQPPIMPRPDLEAIGVKYRRIPIMTIGKDAYCDTRIILSKLEQLFPDGALGASDGDGKAIEKLLEFWKIEDGVFTRASQMIPSDTPIMKDPKFSKDREQFSGRSWNKEAVDKARPEAVAHIRNAFRFLETTLLADNRQWILKTEKPTLADIEAIWAFDWLNGLKGALPQDIISDKQFPKVFAYIARFNKAINAAKKQAPKATTLQGSEAAQRILKSTYAETEGEIDSSDPTGLQKGTIVEVWPIDSGFGYKDKGSLVTLTADEVVIAIENGLHIHFPRTGFRIRQVGNASKL